MSFQVLEDVTGEEFVLFMKILSGLKSLQTVSGRQQLVELVAEQADLEQTFNPSDPDCVDRLLQCTRQAVPLFSVSSLFYIPGILITLSAYISIVTWEILLKPLHKSSNTMESIFTLWRPEWGWWEAKATRNFFKALLRDFFKVLRILHHTL